MVVICVKSRSTIGIDRYNHRSTAARTGMVDLEDLSDEDLKKLQQQFQRLREKNATLVEEGIEAVEEERKERTADAR